VTPIDFPYLMSDRDRHGNERLYVRRDGRKIRIRATPGTEAFAAAYAEALHVLAQGHIAHGPVLKGAPAGTLGWLAACYFASIEFRRLDSKSQSTRRGIIEDCLREPRKPGSRDLMRDCPLSVLSAAHVKMLRDRKAARPAAANNRRKYLSSMFGWAVEHGLLRFNPAREVRKVRYATAGFHTWTVDEVRQFEERHQVGTKARLSLALLLYLGGAPRRCRGVRPSAREGRLAALRAEKNSPQASGAFGEACPAGPRRHHRAQPDRRLDLSRNGIRQSLYRGRIW
jgi:hypothetical protein